MRKAFTAALVAIGLAAPSQALPTARVTRTVDGDTVILNGYERLRVACVDTPERGDYGFDAATRKTRQLVDGKTVSVRRITTDRYGRTVGEIIVNGANLGQELVRTGHARIYWRYAHQCRWTR